MGMDLMSAPTPQPVNGPLPVINEQHDLGREELAALVALDALDGDEFQKAESALDAPALRGPRRVVGALAESASEDPPAELREQVLAAARSRRAPGTPGRPRDPVGPSEAFLATVDDLRELLEGLSPEEWELPSLAQYGRVRDLIAHLVGVEENLLGLLGDGSQPDASRWPDHVLATAGHVETCRSMTTDALLERWHRAARRLSAVASSESPERPITVNDVPTTTRGMFVLRTFEVWTHHEDVCRATGRPLPFLDGSRLRLMSLELMNALPAALTVIGQALPGRTMEIVLTGRGGASYLRPMALQSEVGWPDVTITTDIVDFCRVASHRLAPAELQVAVRGDAELCHRVLVAAGAFARD